VSMKYQPGNGAYFSNHLTRTSPCLGAPGITRAIQYPSLEDAGSTRTAINSPGAKCRGFAGFWEFCCKVVRGDGCDAGAGEDGGGWISGDCASSFLGLPRFLEEDEEGGDSLVILGDSAWVGVLGILLDARRDFNLATSSSRRDNRSLCSLSSSFSIPATDVTCINKSTGLISLGAAGDEGVNFAFFASLSALDSWSFEAAWPLAGRAWVGV